MAIDVECILVLEAVDETLLPGTDPTVSGFPTRVVTIVPPNPFSGLLNELGESHSVASGTQQEYVNLASGIVFSGMPSSFGIDSTPYDSGHFEQDGAWVSGTGYLFRLMESGNGYEDSLPSVRSDCVCKYLLSLRPVV